MKTILLLVVLVVLSQARPLSNAQIHKIEEMKSKNTWGGLLVNLAELHIQSQGPLDQLVDAIQSVVEDLNNKLDRANEEYDRRTEEHTAEVARINRQIDSANQDIADATDFLQNVLYVQKDQLEADLAQYALETEQTQQHILDETALREKQHELFNEQTFEHTEALEAINEAQEVLNQLVEAPSLIQTKKAQKSMEKVQQKVGKSAEGALIKVLLQLETSFADQSDIQKVLDLLAEIRSNLAASLASITENEINAEAAYQADMATCENKIAQLQIATTEANEALDMTNQMIDSYLEFIGQRQRDLAGYQQDLVDENANFDRITELFEELTAQLLVEQKACAEALQVLENGSIADYIGGRMEQDRVIDTAHGMGVTVETDPFDME